MSSRIPVDSTFASFLGVESPAEGEWLTTEFPGRPGIMMHPAMMAAHSHSSDQTPAYVPRGVLLRKQLFCDSLGLPPANAVMEFEALPIPDDPTAREISASVNSQPGCRVCHSQIDPPGLAFESFDGLGRERDTYRNGRPIDPAGQTRIGDTEINFNDASDLLLQAAELPAVQTCFARQVFRFAMSRLDRPADECAIAALERELDASDGRIADALIAMTQTDTFRYRRDSTP